jgi:membrane-anchored protein YejM (alkaline phosphatase superfamily)
MKNLVILHLESISRQRLAAFAADLPHTTRLISEALAFDNFFSSATSTRMVVGCLFHGNDFEYDAAATFQAMQAAANNPHLFSVLRDRGYNADLICLNGFQHVRPIKLRSWSDDLPPIWATHDFPALIDRFDALTDAPPFAIYVWDLITHIEHSLALAPHASGLTDQVRRACAVADDAIGNMRAVLERKGLLDDTTIVIYGDHGDDAWTHGFKGGLTHGTEPYTDMIWAPLAIRDSGLAPGTVDHLASTIDIAPTCLSLLGFDAAYSFPYSGVDLLRGGADFAYSQNLTANQSVTPADGISKAFSVTDKTYTLMASSRGLELYAYRLDPGNHCNLLHFFALDKTGRLLLQEHPGAAKHFRAAWDDNPRAVESLADNFQRLRNALAARIEAKRAYLVERGVESSHAPDPAWLDRISHEGRDAFFRRPAPVEAIPAALPAMEFSYKLR